MKALVIDDNIVSAKDLTRKLEYCGVEVITFFSGEDGLSSYQTSAEGEYDIIFLDIMMPEKKGTEISASIRALEREDAKKIPIIAVTGINYDAVNRAMDVSGFDALLQKPINVDVLGHLVDSVKEKK